MIIRVPGGDSHRHKWPANNWWKVIQDGLTLFGKAYGVLRNKQHPYRYEHLMQQLRGVLVTTMALDCVRYGIELGSFQASRKVKEMLNSPVYGMMSSSAWRRWQHCQLPKRYT